MNPRANRWHCLTATIYVRYNFCNCSCIYSVPNMTFHFLVPLNEYKDGLKTALSCQLWYGRGYESVLRLSNHFCFFLDSYNIRAILKRYLYFSMLHVSVGGICANWTVISIHDVINWNEIYVWWTNISLFKPVSRGRWVKVDYTG